MSHGEIRYRFLLVKSQKALLRQHRHGGLGVRRKGFRWWPGQEVDGDRRRKPFLLVSEKPRRKNSVVGAGRVAFRTFFGNGVSGWGKQRERGMSNQLGEGTDFPLADIKDISNQRILDVLRSEAAAEIGESFEWSSQGGVEQGTLIGGSKKNSGGLGLIKIRYRPMPRDENFGVLWKLFRARSLDIGDPKRGRAVSKRQEVLNSKKTRRLENCPFMANSYQGMGRTWNRGKAWGDEVSGNSAQNGITDGGAANACCWKGWRGPANPSLRMRGVLRGNHDTTGHVSRGERDSTYEGLSELCTWRN